MKTILKGSKVIVSGDPAYNGETGIVAEVFKSRGTQTVYQVELEGRGGKLAFIDGELSPLDKPERRQRRDAGVPRRRLDVAYANRCAGGSNSNIQR